MRSFLAGFTIVLLGIMPAAAGMPPGPSPDSGLAGVWRIVGVQTAPWAKPKTLTKRDAPLLEYAVEFADGAVKGPAPLACARAQYVDDDGPYFGGKLAGDRSGAMAKALHLVNSDIAYRVICGTNTRDYYVDDDANMVMAEGDVIYTLQRPTGMDPEEYEAGFSGPGIDCTRAKITGEKLICSDATLAQSDRKLNAAWRRLKQSISPQSLASFQAAQRAWIAYEMKDCGGTGPMPDPGGETDKIAECLGSAFDARVDLFDGVQTARNGALTIEPHIRFRVRGNPNTEETDIYPVMRGGPQAAAFNTFIVKTLNLDTWRMDDKSVFPYGDVADMKLHTHRSYFVVRFDSRAAMINIGTSDFTGGHDEDRDVIPLAWDLQKSKPIGLEDVFAPGADWEKFVSGYCNKDLLRQTKTDGLTDDLTEQDVRAAISNSKNWVWDKDHATVMFAISMGGGGPDSAYNVDIPYRLLKPYMKPDAPVL
jgi:uncharacterized protein YecT (DUF1311 family)